jgi:hypothetical protein
MQSLTALPIVFLLSATPALASQDISAADAEAMRIEALANSAPERVQGRFDFMLEDPDIAVDVTSGSGGQPDDDCASVPVRVKRSDGSTIMKRVNTCD